MSKETIAMMNDLLRQQVREVYLPLVEVLDEFEQLGEGEYITPSMAILLSSIVDKAGELELGMINYETGADEDDLFEEDEEEF